MCAVVCIVFCCWRLLILNARVRQRERAFEKAMRRGRKIQEVKEEGEKTKMRDGGLGKGEGPAHSMWFSNAEGLDHPYQMHGLRSQDHKGMERSRSNSQASCSLVSEACRWLTFDD